MKVSELILVTYHENNKSRETSIYRILNKLIKKGNIKKEQCTYYFVNDFVPVSKITKSGMDGQTVSVPKINATKDWKIGDKIELRKIE